MDKLAERALAFQKLIGTEYTIVLGHKGDKVILHLNFLPSDFPHLIGLHKLNDVFSGHYGDRILDEIIKGNITYDRISSSENFTANSARFEYALHLEKILDSNDTVFRYNKNASRNYSRIDAEYVMKNQMDALTLYLFMKHRSNQNMFCCVSFFSDSPNYLQGQVKMTLLYKEKRNKETGEATVLYKLSSLKGSVEELLK